MAKRAGPHPGQLEIPSYLAELVPPKQYADVAPESRIAVVSLIDRAAVGLRFGREPSFRDYQHVVPEFIETGLYVAPGALDPERNAEHFVWLGTPRPRAGAEPRKPEPNPDKPNDGVAFQPAEFLVVAHSARALASHGVNKTRRAHWGEPDHKNTEQTANRTGGHILEDMIAKQRNLSGQLLGDNKVYGHLISHLVSPSKVRSQARRLETERAQADEKIHETAEVAVIYLDLGNAAIAGMHRVIKRHLYGNYSHAERTAHMIGLLQMVGKHNRAKLYKLGVSQARCEQKLAGKYQAALDQKAASAAAV